MIKYPSYTYPTMSHAVSRVTFEMFDEFNVELMLNGFAAGPIMEGTRVHGLFVETKSGTVGILGDEARLTALGLGCAAG